MPKSSRKRLANWGLVALGVVTVGAAAFVVVDGSLAVKPEPVSQQVQQYYNENVKDAKATLPAASSPSAAAAPSVMLDAIRASLGTPDPVVISVLGDSTGNAAGEWVDLWAKHLAEGATVTLHEWDQNANAWSPSARTYGTGAKAVTIWNGSQPGSTYVYPLERLDAIQPEKPTFTILNFGHNQATKSADVGSAELLAAVNKQWSATIPAAVTLQNPSQAERAALTAGSVKAIATWAPSAGYPTIDVNKAFTAAGNIEMLLQDDVHPNPAGEQIWADTVIATLG